VRPRVAQALADRAEGLCYAWSHPTLRLALAAAAAVGLVGFNVRVLIPVLTAKTLHAGPHTLGILFACFGIGAVVGALVAASAERLRWRRLLAGLGGLGIALLGLALQRSVWASGALLAVVGLSFSSWSATTQSMLQLTAPDALRGRIVSLWLLLFGGVQPIGSLLSGWLADVGGTRLAFLVAGVCVTAVAVYDAVRIRGLQTREPLARPVEYVEPPV